MEELCLKFDLKDSYSSGLVLVIDLRRQNHFHTWFDFCCFMFLSLLLQGFQSRRTRKWKQRWDFVDWRFVSHCLSNERKFPMHWSHLNIFLGIIEHITPKKPKLHSKRRLQSINVWNAGQYDHLPFGLPKIFVVYLLLWVGFWVTCINNVCDLCQHFCLRHHWKFMNTLCNMSCFNYRTMKKKAQLQQKLLMRTIFLL